MRLQAARAPQRQQLERRAVSVWGGRGSSRDTVSGLVLHALSRLIVYDDSDHVIWRGGSLRAGVTAAH